MAHIFLIMLVYCFGVEIFMIQITFRVAFITIDNMNSIYESNEKSLLYHEEGFHIFLIVKFFFLIPFA